MSEERNRREQAERDAIRSRMANFQRNMIGQPVLDQPDTSETVYISSLALLKMLKHGRAGVPMEVMGLMLGDVIDEFTINVVDVFAMPQSGTGVSVEAVDPVYQAKMLDLLKQTDRPEMVVGWYHSHPGFGCWLSNVDIDTQKSFEALSDRAVGVVIDPIQSVKGKVVIDAFRLIKKFLNTWLEPRQPTSNLGHLQKPNFEALAKGLDRYYYSLRISCKPQENEQKMLLSMNNKPPSKAFELKPFAKCGVSNKESMQKMLKLAEKYAKSIEEEEHMTDEQLAIKNFGKQNPKRNIGEEVNERMSDNIVDNLGTMLNIVCFNQK